VRSVLHAAASGVVAATRIVCLPGAYHAPEDFLTAGFDHSLRERGLPIDLLFVDIEMQHLGDRCALAQLKSDVVAPARALGCQSIWFAGVSLGGFIALDYAASNPDDLTGVCVLAPYLGNRMLLAEIARAPGLAAWTAGELAEADEERRVWRFLQRHGHASRLYLGFGREDRFADAHRLMAQALPQAAVDVIPGGHDWRTWCALWEHFLDANFT
jgi:pimeloyl-ACP methyl ester carboxylesterase